MLWGPPGASVRVGTTVRPDDDYGGTRTRVQLHTESGEEMLLTLGEWADLCRAVREIAGWPAGGKLPSWPGSGTDPREAARAGLGLVGHD